MNATQIYYHLVKESFIPSSVSVDSVQRFIKKNDLKSTRNPNVKDRKAFEEDTFGKCWQADTCYLPYITEDENTHRVYCIMIIDDQDILFYYQYPNQYLEILNLICLYLLNHTKRLHLRH